MEKGDWVDLLITVQLPDPDNPKTGGTLERVIELLNSITSMWATHLEEMGISVITLTVKPRIGMGK